MLHSRFKSPQEEPQKTHSTLDGFKMKKGYGKDDSMQKWLV
jgi:hypothetical protein